MPRLDEVIVFRPLKEEDIRAIAEAQKDDGQSRPFVSHFHRLRFLHANV